MKILVTGSNGQLGNEMRLLGVHSFDEYIFTDVQELDITDKKAITTLVKRENIEVIINCAAYTNVDKAEDDKVVADLINHKAVENLAQVCAECGAALVHVSTDYVFQGDGCIPCTEDMQVNPLGVYGVTKLAGEQAILNSGCKYIIFRTAWLYSAYGNNFVKTMRKLSSEKESLKVVFDQVGTPTYAADLAAIIFKVVSERLIENNQGIYHFSNEGVCSWFDFAIAIANLSSNSCNIQPCHSDEFPSKVRRPHFSVLDKTKLKQTFGVTIPYWTDSLKVCISKLQQS